jgi:two-component system, OmpR family, sensor histidine kinase CiaH
MEQQKKLTYITIGYWVLLLYIVAALLWWFIALNRQSEEMATLRMERISPGSGNFEKEMAGVAEFRSRKKAQYIGEGSIFLVLILVGAVFVYKATRKQLQLARQQQNFMMAVTHELKTPIAVTKLNLETLRLRKLDEKKQMQLVQAAIAETDRLNDLTNNILLASRMENDSEKHFSELFDLYQPLADIVRQFESRHPNHPIVTVFKEGNMVHGDPLMLKLVLSNLLENAMKYTPETSAIVVSMETLPGKILLKVADLGPGIPDEEKEKVFEKFYRMGNESTRSAKGTGLGLYLCKRIIQSHGGRIRIEDNKPGGAVFVVDLPAA